jgi:uncharacterized alkaline shock family protein YloU
MPLATLNHKELTDLSVGSTPNPIATQKASPTYQSKTGFDSLKTRAFRSNTIMTNNEIEGEDYAFDDTPLPEAPLISKTLTIALTEHQWSLLEAQSEDDEPQETEELIQEILSNCADEFDGIHMKPISKTLTIVLTEQQWSSLEIQAEGDELQGTEELIQNILSECADEFDGIHMESSMPEGLTEHIRNEELENQVIPPGYFDDLIRD